MCLIKMRICTDSHQGTGQILFFTQGYEVCRQTRKSVMSIGSALGWQSGLNSPFVIPPLFCNAVYGPFSWQSAISRRLRKTDSYKDKDTKTEGEKQREGALRQSNWKHISDASSV